LWLVLRSWSDVELPLLVPKTVKPYTLGMAHVGRDIKKAGAALCGRVSAWVKTPFENLWRWGFVTIAFAGLCFALPPWVGFILFIPLSLALGVKCFWAIKQILAFNLIHLKDVAGHAVLDTEDDRLQRAWVLAAAVIAVVGLVLLAIQAVFATFPSINVPDTLMTYLMFTSVLLMGFLLFYFLALRFDQSIFRGLTSITVTLPAFFIVVAVLSILLSWAMRFLASIGLSAEGMLKDGFSWLYEVQRILGMATDYFLKQDSMIIAASIVLAALLLLLYTFTIPHYWMKSVSRWLKAIGLIAAAFGAAVLVFAGVWLVDVQKFAAETGSSQLVSALDPEVVGNQAESLSSYKSDDLIALIKAFVLPYTVGLFVANAVVSLRRGKAKTNADSIIDTFAADGSIDEASLPELKKRYLYYGGSLTLWDIALRSIGHDIPLPHPFAPR
ncbi:MAG: hypothetical protein RR619_11145, partial [Raoultibacter sp.]